MNLLAASQSSQASPLAPGTTASHTNFIVLGHARCGSNLLNRALAEHPQIRTVGEVLSNDASTREVAWNSVNRIAWTEPRGDGYRIGDDGAQFLDTKIFGKGPSRNIRAYGFKLFYDHARFDQASATAWDYIVADRDIKVIHLVRHNLLQALVSLEVAVRTQQWHRLIEDSSPIPPPLPAFPLEPNRCLEYFNQITEWRSVANHSFASHNMLTVQYESELCQNFEDTTSRIFDFLGLLRWYARPGMVKQQAIPTSRQLSNFNQLRDFFSGGPYEDFFANDALLVAK